jgi:molybdate transport system regulatory protein
MDLNASFDARLNREGVAFTKRDAELLQAIDEQHSINRAADVLDRSYSRSQQRIVTLEDVFGDLVERTRGGPGGGGSSLTTTARRLLADFDCLRAEFTGVAESEETVLSGTVVESDGELATIETAAGPMRAIIPATTPAVQVVIRADTVTLHTPETTPEADGTSARNRFRSTVTDIEAGEAIAHVDLVIGDGVDLAAIVTQASVSKLDLSPGDDVMASFKATATRGFPANRPATQSENSSE